MTRRPLPALALAAAFSLCCAPPRSADPPTSPTPAAPPHPQPQRRPSSRNPAARTSRPARPGSSEARAHGPSRRQRSQPHLHRHRQARPLHPQPAAERLRPPRRPESPGPGDSFHQQINLPLRVGIVIDASTSIRSRFQFEQQSAIEFLLADPQGRIRPRLRRWASTSHPRHPGLDQQRRPLETGVNRLRPGGGTALFDAVYTACRDKLLDVSRGQEPVRKAIVLISDGDDNQSRVHPDEAIKECERAETIIYAISTNWTPSRGKGDNVLTDMAEATGGRSSSRPPSKKCPTASSDIEDELRSQYALTYTPADFKYDGSFRTIYLYCTTAATRPAPKKATSPRANSSRVVCRKISHSPKASRSRAPPSIATAAVCRHCAA